MGKPRGRKTTVKESPPPAAAPEDPMPTVADASSDEAAIERGRFVGQQRLFSYREVQRRTAAIQAIRDAEIENLLSRMHLLCSCLSKEQQKSHALQFFRENYPNLSVVKNESDGIFELELKDKVGNLSLNHVTIRNVLSSLDTASTLPASGLGLEFSIESFKMNFVEAASLQIPGSVANHRLSVGVTPKSLRLPKHGEMLLSIRGSPLGVYREENLETINESGDCPQGASR